MLEFFFIHYLYICSGSERATSLSTTSVNVYIAIYQLCAISAGFLADKVIGTASESCTTSSTYAHSLHTAGNYLTQVFSVFLATCGIFLLAFSTWQFGISEPECCYIVAGGNSQVVSGNLGEQQNWSGNCSELHKGVLLGSADLHMTPGVTMALALVGLLVRDTL